MAIAGLRGTGDWATDERPKNFRELILWRNPNGAAPLTALMAKMKAQSVDDPEFAWWEEELNALRLTASKSGGQLAGDTSIDVTSNVTDAYDVVPGDLLQVEKTLTSAYDHEIMLVTGVTDADTITVTRGYLGTTAAAIAQNTGITKIGNIYSEGSNSPNVSSRNPSKLFNYCQIFKTAYELTNTAKKTRTRTGDPLQNDKKRKLFDHSTALEFSALFGKRWEGTGANGKPIRASGGLLYMLSQYAPSMITVYSAAVSETTFMDAVYKVFDYNTGAGDERIAFVGNGALNALNRLANAQARVRINYDGIVDVFGMRLQRWVLPQGTLYIKSHPLFNTHGRYTNDMAIIDPSVIKVRQLRATKPMDNIQANDSDTMKGQWLTEEGWEYQHLKTCAWLSNITYP